MRPVNFLLGRTSVAKTNLTIANTQFGTAQRVEALRLADAQAARATATAADAKVARIETIDRGAQIASLPAGPLTATATGMAIDHQSFGEAMFKPGGLGNVATLGLSTDIGAITDFYGGHGASEQAAAVGRQLTPQPIS